MDQSARQRLELRRPRHNTHVTPTGTILIMRILRLLRVLRIFKLARYSRGLQTFGDTMAHSLRELSMLGMFLFTGIIFFSTVLYFLEKVSDGNCGIVIFKLD
jgi:hypothetical protein